ncbi:DnaJ- protein scj1, partial [Entomortierella lignicola]
CLEEGSSVPFGREADEFPDVVPGDLIFDVLTRPHATFERRQNNLYTYATITLEQALLGFELEVKHLDGKAIKLTRGQEVTPFGFVQTLQGRGMPIKGSRGDFGDLVEKPFDEKTFGSAHQQQVMHDEIRFERNNSALQSSSLRFTDATPLKEFKYNTEKLSPSN